MDRLAELEERARRLDTEPGELSLWMERLTAFATAYLRENADGPAYRAGAESRPPEPMPTAPASLEEVLGEFRERIGNRGIVPTSGRFFGYVPGGGVPSAAVGDFLAALTNRYSGVYAAAPGAAEIENETVRWLIEMVGYPAGAWGTLQSGGSLATLTAVVAARETRSPERWTRGVLYRTEECHLAIQKALHIAGLGHVPVRTVPVDPERRLSVPDLVRLVERDRAQGLEPWMVFASAGTVNTGAVDPLPELADLAAAERLWLHVDGAYGGFFRLTGTAAPLLAGMERADTLVLDPHKGLFQPYGLGAVLARQGELLRRGFAFTSSYLRDVESGTSPSPSDYSPELTRHFRGLRLWMSLKLHGVEPFRAALEEKLLLARLAQDRLRAMPGVEVGPEPQLSTVAFRVRAADDRPTEGLLARMLERGRVHVSSTRLEDRLYLRLCVLCFRSHRRDLEAALEEVATGVR